MARYPLANKCGGASVVSYPSDGPHHQRFSSKWLSGCFYIARVRGIAGATVCGVGEGGGVGFGPL